MKRIVILTGDELRHRYFRTVLSHDLRFEVLATMCEGVERSLEARVAAKEDASFYELQHIAARKQSEEDFFGEVCAKLEDRSKPIKMKKGEINNPEHVARILDLKPDLLICYGSSLIKTELLTVFEGRFLNVHLGLSPYYRGSGTNVWPLINKEPWMVGATFMYIDAGIDTGKIIHQIRADVLLGDGPHAIGNRLIRKMTTTYADIVANFDALTPEEHPPGGGALYKNKDFDAAACARLYANFGDGMVEDYIKSRDEASYPPIVRNRGLAKV